ncbi:hypothetical protein J2756_002039 [Methanobacterium aggregans]|nr:hypothetical protein [Methanobacterium aggregans]
MNHGVNRNDVVIVLLEAPKKNWSLQNGEPAA